MKNITTKNKILIIILILVIIAGILVTANIGLNFDLRYEKSQKIELNLGKEFETSDIKNITNEIFPNQEVIIQKVELYKDTVCIIAKEITEEQRNNIEEKVNEKYGTELVAEDTEIFSIPHTRGRDIIKPYITPFVIATVIIIIYMAIRYYKLNSIKVILKTIGISILTQLVLLSIMAIARIPIGRITIPLVIIVYMLTLIGITTRFEKNLDQIKEE